MPTILKDYIDRNTHENKNLNDICSVLHISKSTVIRTFKKAYGMTPYKYTQQKRIQTIKNLLETTDMSIKQIAKTMHYDSKDVFIRQFKKIVGISPGQYRKTHKQ